MNDTSPDISNQTSDKPEDWQEGDDLPVAQVRELFGVFVKALRSFQLYDELNPVRKRFVNNLREAFEALWQEVEGVNLSVDEDAISMAGEQVYQNSSRSDSLAFLLYKDGIRDVTILPGVEGPELENILGVLQRAKMLQTAEADDILTMLWEEDLAFFKCQSVDQITEGAATPTAQSLEDRADLSQVYQAEIESEDAEADEEAGEEAGAAEDEPSPPKVGQDFSPALYGLDPDETEELRRQLESEMSRDLRYDVLTALFDRLEEVGYPERKSEILTILRELLPTFLSGGDVASAAGVLEELATVRAEPGILDDALQGECDALLDDLPSAETLSELVRGIQDGTIDVPVDVLGHFLQFLRADSLAVLLQASGQEETSALQETLRKAVYGIAQKNGEAVVSLLHDTDPTVVAGAVRLVGEMGMTDAAVQVSGLLMHSEVAVRIAVVESARLLKEDVLTDTVVGALSDDESDVRVASARALVTLGYEAAGPVLEASVTGKEIRQADLTEKIVIFESFGVLGGSGAVDVLSDLLNKKGFLGRREPSEIRASAARGLGKVGLPGAKEALQVSQNDDDAVVRTAVRRAIQGDGEVSE